MGTSLQNTKIKDTYEGLIKTTDNSTVGSSDKELTDGAGNDLNISVNNTGDITAVGDVTAASLIKTGGTALQILLADGTVITLTRESDAIGSNDSDSNIPSNAAVKDYVDTEITNLIDGSPTALDTLNELAAALGDDANFSTTITTALGNRLRFDASQSLNSTEITQALTNLGITATVAEINFIDGVTSNIQTQINGLQTQITGGATTVTDTDLTADRALVSNGSGKVAVSDVTSTEIGHLDGVTSSIQTQLDGKQATITGAATTIDDTDLTASRAVVSDGSGKIAASDITSTELGHLDGVTSAIQTQLDSKQATITGAATTIDDADLTANRALLSNASGKVAVSDVTSTEIGHLDGVSSNIQTQLDAKTDTTYTISAVDSANDAIIRLTDSGSTTDDVKLVAGDNITITPSGDDITIASTASGGGGGVSWQSTPKTSDFTATAGEGYSVNTTSASITVTLPASPSGGDEVSIVDYAGTADTNYIIITSPNNINGSSSGVKIDYERGGVSMVYIDATQGWLAYNAANETATALNTIPLTVDYLVVAGGGGGGGDMGGGGGAGGLRTSYGSTSGGGASAESSLTLSRSTDYTVTVGSGGTKSSGAFSNNGTNGSNSVFSTITSTGGGRGASRAGTSSPVTGSAGGSGGGGSGKSGGGAGGGGGAGTANQGFSGGSGISAATIDGGGGGGGASQVGTNAVNGGQADGGDGLSVSITGSSVTYAGGGGGNGNGLGGSGGGGNNQTNGTNNTGGGGGGSYSSQTAGNGGSGVVILRYPNIYTISETTSPTVLTFSTATDGSEKVTTFTAGENGTIQFS